MVHQGWRWTISKAFSLDLRERIIGFVEGGGPRRGAAADFGVSARCAIKLVDRWRRSGSAAPGRQRGQAGRAQGTARARGHQQLWILDALPATLFPDLNPIEMAFAKSKQLLRKFNARTIDALWQTIGETCALFTPQECWNFFQHHGHARALT